MDAFVTDTMAIILWIEKRKMPQKAKEIFIKAERNEVLLHIPAMVLVEISYLSERKRIEISLNDALVFANKYKADIHSVDIELVRSAFYINDIPELHDRLIAASGIVNSCAVITNDPKIIASKFVTTVWN